METIKMGYIGLGFRNRGSFFGASHGDDRICSSLRVT